MINHAASSRTQGHSDIRVDGHCSYQILSNNRIQIAIDSISNNRDSNNISGTLAIELWNLPQPYHGGDFRGVAIAAVQIGEIFGQYCLHNAQYFLDLINPIGDNSNLCLMLREWDNGGFVTRDFVNFDAEFVSATPTTKKQEGNVITVEFGSTESKIDCPSVPLIPTPETCDQAPVLPSVSAEALTDELPPPVIDAAVSATKIKKAEAIEKSKAAKNNPSAASTGKLSVNTAEMAELQKVKGLTKKLAEAIIKHRPFTTLDELLAIKGMGKKTLDKLQDKISL